MKNVKYGKCVRCGKTYDAVPDLTNCACGGILDIVYDYDYIKSVLTKEKLAKRENRSMWRYRELLPVEETTPDTPLRVGWSPLYEEPKLAELLGIKKLWVKDDGQNPTASLKDRASAMAVAKAMEAGAKTIACSSTGNAASSLAGNAAAAGIKTFIFVPERAPQGKVAQLMIFGANVISVKGNYEDTFKMSAAAIEKYGWYNRNAAINPYLSEGKKTVALEIAEQLNWEMPDYLAISVGDGCTIAGVWKGFKDLYAIGFIDKLPRLISAQSLGCYPINRAIQNNEPWEPMEENTIADSISVGVPRNADKALAAIRESNGIAVNVSDEEILAAQRLLGEWQCSGGGEMLGDYVTFQPDGRAATSGLPLERMKTVSPQEREEYGEPVWEGYQVYKSTARERVYFWNECAHILVFRDDTGYISGFYGLMLDTDEEGREAFSVLFGEGGGGYTRYDGDGGEGVNG